MLAKSLSFLARADAAGIVLGARVPITSLTSRADSLLTRLASCAGGHGRTRHGARPRPLPSCGRRSRSDANIRPVLTGQRALIVGVANDQSIAYGCCDGVSDRPGAGARDPTWLNDRARRTWRAARAGSRRRDHGTARRLRVPGQVEAIIRPYPGPIGASWTSWFTSIAFAPREDLHGGLSGFAPPRASPKRWMFHAHSFIRMAKLAPRR